MGLIPIPPEVQLVAQESSDGPWPGGDADGESLGYRLVRAVIDAHEADYDLPTEPATKSAWDLLLTLAAGGLSGEGAVDIAIAPEGAIELVVGLGEQAIDITIDEEGRFHLLRHRRATGEIEEIPANTPEDVVRAVGTAA